MAKNLSHNMKRVAAGVCALTLAAGAVPVQPLAELFAKNAAVASADGATASVSDASELSSALANTDVTTIRLTGDITWDGILPINRTVTIDLNGKTLTGARYISFDAAYTVTIENGNIDAPSASGGGYFYSGYAANLTVKNLNVKLGDNASSVFYFENPGSVITIDNAYFYGKKVAFSQNSATINGQPADSPISFVQDVGFNTNTSASKYSNDYFDISVDSAGDSDGFRLIADNGATITTKAKDGKIARISSVEFTIGYAWNSSARASG